MTEQLNYEQVLSVALGAVGSRVAVGIMSVTAEARPSEVALLRMPSAVERSHRTTPTASTSDSTSPQDMIWMLDRRKFAGAGWLDPEETALLIQIGSVGCCSTSTRDPSALSVLRGADGGKSLPPSPPGPTKPPPGSADLPPQDAR